MRFKQIWTAFPLPAKLKLFWERVTFSRITKLYFLFSVLHCLVQVVFQIQAFTINARAADFLWHLVTQADARDPGFAVFGDDELRFCETVPDSFLISSCQQIWAASNVKTNSSAVSGAIPSSDAEESQLSTQTLSSASLAFATTDSLLSTTATSAAAETSSATSSLSSSVSSTSTTSSTSSSTVALPAASKDDSSVVAPAASAPSAPVPSVPVPSASAVAPPALPSPSTPAPAAPSIAVGNAGKKGGDDGDDDDDEDDDKSDDESDAGSDVSDDDELEKRDNLGFRITAVNTNGSAQVVINGFGFNNEQVELSRRCLYTLNWPVEKLDNTKREDITFIAFQFWVLGMSIVAILNESIPHIIASLVTHVLATIWGGLQINHTEEFRRQFNELTTQGACDGVNLLRNYWKARGDPEIASLVLNGVALILSAILSWRLFKAFGWQTFKRVGASRTINRIYKLVLTLSIAIQLSLFFIVVSIALWIDSLCNGAVGRLSTNPTLLKGLMVAVIVLLVPWLTLGWIAVRRELRLAMTIFLVLSFGYLGGWGAMFISPTFRWTIKLWQFFMLMTLASVILTLLTLVLGILCRINFGKGLPRYLNAEEPLPDNFEPVVAKGQMYDDEEKVEFPSGRAALPTFSVAFAMDVPPSQMKFSPPRLGPRFTNPSIEPFESSTEDSASQRTTDSGYRTQTTYSRETYQRETPSDAGPFADQRQLSRQTSVGSQRSYSSHSSDKSHGSNHSYGSYSTTTSSRGRNDPFSNRWMIE
ncbi:uncharacterized protein FOMMEDRAFT_133567 [Fomitiporia mediterranea MF3/22]|uniref:uncharacterized protein n=1 Tax=Fomitiporia mediterranea (strain MF3/22) TaxID=694068 RepID=UPI0004409592|nr:uncharacterized protein FOMMEDRAFT_133567 [Fomitiporia mediterranea MF3/22]EJD04260.1 hypothetical protein FOMMEDRAFT_133567 [Fomitiporia mediterranea MF3/22]